MVLIPSRRKDGTLVFKTCIYGPSESGRKTAIEWLYGKEGLASSKLNEFKDEKSSMLFFDRLAENAPNLIFKVYTLDVSDESNARMIFKGADSILFIWDSLIEKWGNNISSLKSLLRFYWDKLIQGNDPPDVPIVVLANKRDLENIVEISKIRKALDTAHLNHTLIYETIAIQGINVKRAFVYAARQSVLNHYKKLSGKLKEKKIQKVDECGNIPLIFWAKDNLIFSHDMWTHYYDNDINELNNLEPEEFFQSVLKKFEYQQNKICENQEYWYLMKFFFMESELVDLKAIAKESLIYGGVPSNLKIKCKCGNLLNDSRFLKGYFGIEEKTHKYYLRISEECQNCHSIICIYRPKESVYLNILIPFVSGLYINKEEILMAWIGIIGHNLMKYKSNLKIFKNDFNKFVELIKISEIPERDKIVNLLQIYLKDIHDEKEADMPRKELERETELKDHISKIDLIIDEYKRFPSKKIIEMIEILEELLNICIEKFEASKTVMALDLIMQEASKYATKETNEVISYQKYQILLGTLISKVKTLIPLLKERLEELKI